MVSVVILNMSRRHAHMVALVVSVVVLVVAPLVLALAMPVQIIADASIFPVVLIAHVNRRWLLIAIMFDSTRLRPLCTRACFLGKSSPCLSSTYQIRVMQSQIMAIVLRAYNLLAADGIDDADEAAQSQQRVMLLLVELFL